MIGFARWSPSQYSVFEDQRNRPIRDLLAAVRSDDVRTAADLGCGPGNSTEMLAARYPGAEIEGLDSSPEMIVAARERLPRCRFEVGAIEQWEPLAPVGVVLANASLQWVPDHALLFPRLMERLAPGGSLAIQMPDNLDEPAHVLMRDVARSGPWAGKLAAALAGRPALEQPGWYYGLLRPRASEVDVWRTVYHHPLAGVDAVVEWFRGSGLRPFLTPLSPEERSEFLRRYREALSKAFTPAEDGSVLLPFPRLFVVARR